MKQMKDREDRSEHPGKPAPIADAFPEMNERILGLIGKNGASLGSVAKAVGVSRPTLYRMIRGEGNPSFSSFVALADHLRTSLVELLGPQAQAKRDAGEGGSREPLLVEPPPVDPRAMEIYRDACRGVPEADLAYKAAKSHFLLPGESPETSISRAILDVFYRPGAWIDHRLLAREHELERKIQDLFRLPHRPELEDHVPVRVIDLPDGMLPMIKIHAVAVVAASLVKLLLRTYRILGFADGFVVSTVQRMLLRGDLTKAELVPLAHTPRFAQFELSGASLIGALARTHHGYGVCSTIGLEDLQDKIRKVEVAVTSCASIEEKGPHSRLAVLMGDANPDQPFGQYLDSLRNRGAVGDLLYHFLGADGKWLKNLPGCARDIESVSLRELGTPAKDDPSIYSLSPEGMARIARRGVSLLIVHTEKRAALARAALLRKEKPVNFLILTRDAAQALVGAPGRRRHAAIGPVD
jgi:hypothetical protein